MGDVYSFETGEKIYTDATEEERSVFDYTVGEIVEELQIRAMYGYNPIYYVISKEGVMIEDDV